MSAVLQKKGGQSTFPFPCDPSVEVGDYVYIRSDGVLDKAKADSVTTMPAIGKVLKKTNATECVISDKLIDEDYTGITPRESFFISSSNAGEIQTFAPASPNYCAQLIGYGVAGDRIWVDIDPTNMLIRS